MVPPRRVLWVLLVLLGCTLGRASPGTCSVPDILRHYRAVIFEDLQAAVRRGEPEARSGHHRFLQKRPTGAGRRRGRPGVSCRAQEEHRILLSIRSLGQTLRGALAGGRRSTLETAAWTVAARTEAVMRRHCGARRRVRLPPRPARRRGRRRLLQRALDAVAACWEKLFALRAAAAGGPGAGLGLQAQGPGAAP